MKRKLVILTTILAFVTVNASGQVTPDLQDKIDQKPNTTKVDVIILTQPNANERAKEAVRNSNGNVSRDFSIIDGVAVTIPKVAAENLANRAFIREIQPDYNVATNLDESTNTINADQVWTNSTGENVDVAVLDTGIEDNTILNVEKQVDYTGEGTDDLNGHGTHVAGTVASTDDQYRGVAYNTDLFDVKVLDQEGQGSASDVIAGLEYAANNNLEVATLSLGAEVSECDGTSSISEAVDNTVEQGVTVTVAAGNNGPDSETITAPGCAQKPITVGSSGNGEISSFSSRGPTSDGRVKPDVVAPGESITSLTNNDGSGPNFVTLSGTSMATPHVAGTAALMHASNDTLTPTQIKNTITSTAVDLGAEENSQGSGRLDSYAAYQEISTTQEKENQPPNIEVVNTEVETLEDSAEATFTVNATDQENESLDATFYLDGEQVSQQDGYGELSYRATNLSLNTTYSWSAEASDGINTSETETVEFNTDTETENQAPAIEAVDTLVDVGDESAEVTLTVVTADEDDETLQTTFYIDGESVASKEGKGEISHKESGLSLNTDNTWKAETTDGKNTSETQTIQFNTDTENETEENQTEGDNQSKPELPPQASDKARKARGSGLFNPNSGLYGIDLALDRASVAVGLRSRESVMEERASEARKMVEKGNTKAAEKAIKNLRNTAGNTENSSRQAEETLNRVIEDSPKEAQQGLRNALSNVEKERENRTQRERGQNQKPENPRQNQNREQDQRPSEPQQRNQRREGGQREAPPASPQETGESNRETGEESSEANGETRRGNTGSARGSIESNTDDNTRTGSNRNSGASNQGSTDNEVESNSGNSQTESNTETDEGSEKSNQGSNADAEANAGGSADVSADTDQENAEANAEADVNVDANTNTGNTRNSNNGNSNSAGNSGGSKSGNSKSVSPNSGRQGNGGGPP